MEFDEIQAPASWCELDFISDLHLHDSDPATFLAWRNYLENSPADAVFILGDLFEVWVGDDVLSTARDANLIARHEGLHFEDRCTRVLHFAAEQRPLYFMAGNRDFLVGDDFLAASGMQRMLDPCVLVFGGQRYLLTHGDALCLADREYQEFRTQVRSKQWQSQFLSIPLQERIQQARQMRVQSEARKLRLAQQQTAWVDVDAAELAAWMQATKTQHVIHGHTHEGRDHPLPSGGIRHVLTDWQVGSMMPRGHILRLSLDEGQGAVPTVRRVPLH